MEPRAPRKELTTPEFKQKLAYLYVYMAKKLGIRKAPNVKVVDSPKNSNDMLGLTAHYTNDTELITLYSTGRHPKDILRSFAHELIHHWQNEHGSLHSYAHDDKQYAQHDPILRQREKEAYLLGNILFRDFCDMYKYGNDDVYTKSQTDTRR